MNSDPPKPPFNDRTTEDLVRDLDVALRQIGVRATSLPESQAEILPFITTVKGAYSELLRRSYQLSDLLKELSAATGWRMEELLDDCLRYPEIVPHTKEASGLRLRYKCSSCGQCEFPESSELWWCNDCVNAARRALRSGVMTERFEIFKDEDKYLWCQHANASTPMISDNPYHDDPGLCADCLDEIAKVRGIGDAT